MKLVKAPAWPIRIMITNWGIAASVGEHGFCSTKLVKSTPHITMCRNTEGTKDQYHSCCESIGLVSNIRGTIGRGLNATASLSAFFDVLGSSWMCSPARSSYAHSIANPNCTSAACAAESSSMV